MTTCAGRIAAEARPAGGGHRAATPWRRPGAVLVVLAGLPGAGKTTLLRRLAAGDELDALDSEDVGRRLAALPVPYRALRPVVHTAHLLRVLAVARRSPRGVLTSDPMTSPLRRLFVRGVALATRRRLVVVLVHVDPRQARDGQRRRGRMLSERRMRRHERRYDALLSCVAPDAVVVDRRSAAEATRLADVLRPRTVTEGPGTLPHSANRSSCSWAVGRPTWASERRTAAVMPGGPHR